MDGEASLPARRLLVRTLATFVGIATLAACLTVLFLGMRTVMLMGGSCASGGPYVVANPCPRGIGWMMPVSILLGLCAVGWTLVWSHGLPGPQLAVFAWPALFLSLGWNFWEFGINPPGDASADAGWIVCGVLFVAMGGVPLLALRGSSARRSAFWSDAPERPSRAERPTPRQVVTAVTPTFPRRAGGSGSSPAPRGSQPPSMVDDLERLADLHRRGALSDAEFAAAKQALLGGE